MSTDDSKSDSPSDYQLVISLHRAGLREFEFKLLNRESLRFSSASILAQSLIAEHCPGAIPAQIDSIHLAIRILWNRWLPERASFEIVNDWMQDGCDALKNNDRDHALTCWFQTWRFINHLSGGWKIRSIREFDQEERTFQSLHNWIHDFLDALEQTANSDWDDLLYFITLCQQMLDLSADSEHHRARIHQFMMASLEKLGGSEQGCLQFARDAELNAIVRDLNRPYNRHLPELAIREAQRNRKEIIPRLILLLRQATSAARTGDIKGQYDGVLLALFLLAEFEAREALPALQDLLTLPDDKLDVLLGDAITDSLSLFLSAIADPESVEVDDLISNRQLNEYVRWEGAQTFMHWVSLGKITRESAASRLGKHLLQACENHDETIAGPLVCELDNYALAESLPIIERACEMEIVDQLIVSLANVKETLKDPDTRFQLEIDNCGKNKIVDTVQSLSCWTCYSPKEPRAPVVPFQPPVSRRKITESPALSAAVVQSGTIRKPAIAVGRNDPCPCSSGKKYKKCCMRGG